MSLADARYRFEEIAPQRDSSILKKKYSKSDLLAFLGSSEDIFSLNLFFPLNYCLSPNF